jgi:hypothetical protein
MDEINPILFYGILYRIGELIIKTKIKNDHTIHPSHEDTIATPALNFNPLTLDPSYELELLGVIILEGYKYYLLFSLSNLRGKFSSFNIAFMASILTIISTFATVFEGSVSLRTFLMHLLLSSLRVLITSCSAVFIQKSKGRLAGFLDLCNVIMENLMMLILTNSIGDKFEDTQTLVAIISCSITVLWYVCIDFRVIKRVIGTIDGIENNSGTLYKYLFFMALSLFKFLEYPNYHGVYPTAFMADDVLQDVFVTIFIFIMLFMKGNRRRSSFQSLSNTISVVFVFIHCLCHFVTNDLYLKVLMVNSQINTIRTILEFCFIRKAVFGKRVEGEEKMGMTATSFMITKAFFGTMFLISKIMVPQAFIILSPMINVCMSLVYLSLSNERMLSYIKLPNVGVILSFFFLITLFN